MKPYERPLLLASEAAARGAAIVALATTEPLTARVSIASAVAFDTLPGWGETMKLPIPARMRALASPDCRAELERALEDGSEPAELDPGRAGRLGEPHGDGRLHAAERAPSSAARWARSRQDAEHGPSTRSSTSRSPTSCRPTSRLPAVGDDAERRGRRTPRGFGATATIVGGSDSGTHLDAICGASVTTSLFSEGVRRTRAPLGRGSGASPHRSAGPALRATQRGSVQEVFADLVLDPDRIGPGEMSLRTDLPEGEHRLYCDAQGIDGVFVNGSEIIHDNEFTGERPGTGCTRSGRDTETVRGDACTRPRLIDQLPQPRLPKQRHDLRVEPVEALFVVQPTQSHAPIPDRVKPHDRVGDLLGSADQWQ